MGNSESKWIVIWSATNAVLLVLISVLAGLWGASLKADVQEVKALFQKHIEWGQQKAEALEAVRTEVRTHERRLDRLEKTYNGDAAPPLLNKTER